MYEHYIHVEVWKAIVAKFAISEPCDSCGADRGQDCITKNGRRAPFHTERHWEAIGALREMERNAGVSED